MYSAFKEFYNLLSQVDSAYHDAALKLGLTDSELDILYSLNVHGSNKPISSDPAFSLVLSHPVFLPSASLGFLPVP